MNLNARHPEDMTMKDFRLFKRKVKKSSKTKIFETDIEIQSYEDVAEFLAAENFRAKFSIYLRIAEICQLKGETLMHFSGETFFVQWLAKADEIYTELLALQKYIPENKRMDETILIKKLANLIIMKDTIKAVSCFQALKTISKEPDIYHFQIMDKKRIKRGMMIDFMKHVSKSSFCDSLRYTAFKNSLYINDHFRINNKYISLC